MKTYRAIAAVISILMLAISATGCTETTEKQGKAKYIFLFIGDGMGNSQVAVTEAYMSWKEGKLGGSQLSFTQFPVFGTATSHSANSNITDSSAAGTAISTGVKTNNGYLGTDPEGNPVKSMSYDLKEDGYSIGIISSVPINYATPGSFYGHNIDRGGYYAITQEIPATGFEYFASAGILQYFGPDGNSESSAALLDRQQAGRRHHSCRDGAVRYRLPWHRRAFLHHVRGR